MWLIHFSGQKWGANWIISGSGWERFDREGRSFIRVRGRINRSETPIHPPIPPSFNVQQHRPNSWNIFRSFADAAGCRTNFQSEVLTQRRPLIKSTGKNGSFCFQNGVLQSTSLKKARFSVLNGVSSQTRNEVLDKYFGIFYGCFFALGQEMAVPYIDF